jgi:hypothetical protein
MKKAINTGKKLKKADKMFGTNPSTKVNEDFM